MFQRELSGQGENGDGSNLTFRDGHGTSLESEERRFECYGGTRPAP
jgi:hypothetical protein